MIRNASLSPTGVRAAFEARGEIFTVPAEKGDYRNLTQSTGAHDRSPVWSPDGDAARVALRRERRVSADDRRADRRHQAARDRAAVGGVLLRARLVARRQAAAASRTTI